MTALPDIPLPSGIRSRYVDNINGLRMHVLEAGFETNGRPCVLLLHGFPELAFSWRKVMPQLAAAGYHVIAPDQRGYGRTTGWDAELRRRSRLVPAAPIWCATRSGWCRRSAIDSVDAVFGHDFGSSVAAWCALLRPDVFRSVALMSAPFAGPPALPFNTADAPAKPAAEDPIHRELAALPRPRKHYQWYYSTREANANMHHAPQGVHDFLRAYYHHKSADWKDNAPYPLKSWTAGEIAKLPTYYVMDLVKDMAATVAEEMPSAAEIAANTMAAGQRTFVLQRRIYPHRFSGRPAMVSLRHLRRVPARTADLVGPHHRRALGLHLGQAGLGHLSAPRRIRDHADEGLHQHDRLPSRRWRRPLGAAGAARGSEPAAAAVSGKGQICPLMV